MAYHTAVYLFVFLPVTAFLYQLTPKKWRWATLLIASYVFFWSFSEGLLYYLIGTSFWTYIIGRRLEDLQLEGKQLMKDKERSEKSQIKKEYKKKQKRTLIIGIVALLAILGYLKYYNFFAENINQLFSLEEQGVYLETKKLLLPIGISFYTLQAIGYMADVYWGKIEAQKDLGKIALFLGFFPQIMEGPIAMYHQTAETLWEGNPIKEENLSRGCLRILWGLFKKMLIADRLNMLVNTLFTDYKQYEGVMIIVAAIAYTIQLYMEFSGSMDIIIGTGKIFGVTLPENFRQPFFSKSASEFWRRWHITLGAWFKAYIFYPVSASKLVKKWNKFGKKKLSKHVTKLGVSAIALFPVWMSNGLWHGARWSYIFYGFYYFTVIMLGLIIEPARNAVLKALHINEKVWWYQLLQMFKTWIIIFTGELFFRADELNIGIKMFFSIFKGLSLERLWDGTLWNLGLDKGDLLVVGLGCIVVFAFEILKEMNIIEKIQFYSLRLPVRWIVYYGLMLSIVILGAYGPGYQMVDLIYAGF